MGSTPPAGKRRSKSRTEPQSDAPPPTLDLVNSPPARERRFVTGENVFTVYSAETYDQWYARMVARMGDESDNRVRRIVESIPEGPVTRWLSPAPRTKVFDDLACRFPNCVDVLSTLQDYAALCSEQSGFRFPPILLLGRPGTGKTALARALGRELRAPPVFLSMAGASGGFSLGGLDLRWSTGCPGAVFETLVLAERKLPANRLMVLDEIDKAERSTQSNPLGHLYTLIEPSTARAFRDEAIDMPIDSTPLLWIATANELQSIAPPLRSRFEIIEVPPPTKDQVPAVVRSVWTDLRHEEAWWAEGFDAQLSDAVVERLRAYDSVREMVKALRRAAGKARARGDAAVAASDIPKQPSAGGARSIGFT